MERLVLYLCGLWFWMTRKYRTSRYQQVAELLDSAKLYLISDFNGRASTRDRGFLLPDQVEALRILEQRSSFLSQTSSRFQSLSECVRLVTEELIEPPRAA
jgi:hypothetical protein